MIPFEEACRILLEANGMVICCNCFDHVKLEDLGEDAEGNKVDVCKKCRVLELKRGEKNVSRPS